MVVALENRLIDGSTPPGFTAVDRPKRRLLGVRMLAGLSVDGMSPMGRSFRRFAASEKAVRSSAKDRRTLRTEIESANLADLIRASAAP